MPGPRTARRSVRLFVESLDERIAPANNLTVVAAAGTTTNVTSTLDAGSGTLTLSATGPGAQLKITDIQDAMKTAGVTRVVVTTADAAGPEDGDISWAAAAGNLDFNGFGTGRTLALRAAGDIHLTDVYFLENGANSARLEFDTMAGNGDVAFHAGPTNSVLFDQQAVAALTVNAGTGTFTYEDAPVPAGFSYARAAGDITITAGQVVLNNRAQAGHGGWTAGGAMTVSAPAVHLAANFDATGALTVSGDAIELGGGLAAGGPLTVSGPVTLVGDSALGRPAGDPRPATPVVTVAGTVNGPFALNLNATAVSLTQSVGGTTPLTAVRFVGGDVQYGANPIRATDIMIGDGFLPLVTLSGTGPLTGDVTVRADGTLRPAGAGVADVLPITGGLTFSGGQFGLDLGPTSDRIQVTGNVLITSGWLDAAGFLPGVGDVKVIDFTGTLTGSFNNAPAANTFPILTATDIVTVSHYGPAATGVTVAPFKVQFNAVGGSDYDGTGLVARLIGPGVLGAIQNPDGSLLLATHGTTALSKLVVTTTANGSDDIVRFAGIFVHGSLGALSAPKADSAVRVDGTVATVSLRTVEGLTVSGIPGKRTALTAAAVPGDVSTTGGLSATVAGAFTGDLTAASIGSLRAQTVTGPAWTVAGHVGSLTAGTISGLALTARSIGTLTVTGKPGAFAGNVTDSTITLTGNTGPAAGRVALGTANVKGAVTGSRFDILDGNVTRFTTGRFLNSQLYLGYAPVGAFDTGGDFDLLHRGKLGRFVTTAVALNDPANPSNFAFAGSQVAADTFGVVRLSGLKTDNGGTAFGLKFHTARGSIRVAAAGPASLPLNTDLDPATGHAGNFSLLAG
ncbi:MAG TPA: hypothetical protein VKD90_23140 [Gemmataceae bacterium]|nr:hypothetical protein [Gemmataceae bacterium]